MSTNPYDAAARSLAQGSGGSTLYQVQDSDPEKAGRANRAAQILGIPPELVEANLPASEQRIRMEQAQAGMARDPKLASWASDPRHAALATDDFENLNKLSMEYEKKYGVLSAPPPTKPSFFNFFRGAATAFTESWKQSKAALNLEVQDYINYWSPSAQGERDAASLKRDIEGSQSTAAQADPNFKNWYMRQLYGGVSSTAQAAPAVAIGVLTRNPFLTASIMAGQVRSQAYGKYRVRGATPTMANVGGGIEGAAEGAFELMPMGYFVDNFGKKAVSHFIAGTLIREVPTEVATTIAQQAVDTAIANPDKTWADYFSQLPGDIGDTIGATVVQSFLMGGPSAFVGHHGEVQQARQAERDADFLNNLAQGTKESKVHKRDPSAFARFLEMQLDGGPAENLYIPAEKIRELYQSSNSDWHSADDPYFGQIDGAAEQIDQALATNGDVVVKTSDFATKLAGTPAWEALKDHVRASPAGMSLDEARQWAKDSDAAMQKTGEELAGQMEADREAMAPRQKLFEAARDKLMLAGFTPDVAAQYAVMTAARYATRAERMGQTLTGNELDALDIKRGEDGTPVSGGRVMAQRSYPLAPRDEWHGEADFKERGGRVVMMAPDEYLDAVRPLEIDETSRDNIDDLKQHILSGKRLDPLLIRATGKEDGRHRAVAAKELGIDQVPVVVFGDQFAGNPVVDLNDHGLYTQGNERGLYQRPRDGTGRYSGGGLAPLEGAPTFKGATGPDPGLVAAAEAYAKVNGIDLARQGEYVEVDEERAKRIAAAYEAMDHAPNDPAVQEAFAALIEQTLAQYQALVDAGYTFYLFDETNDPYDGNPVNAMRDIRSDKRLGVFATEAGFGTREEFEQRQADNPMLADTGIKWPYGSPDGPMKRVFANDIFRAVHDAFGHGLEGAGFRARGEENAWQAHARLYTGQALGALASETRGQNSWLNFGPHGEHNQTAAVEDTIFADQKTGLMPAWTWQEGMAPDAPRTLFQSATIRAGKETLKKYGLDPTKKYTTREVAAALEARQRAKYGAIARDDRSPEAARKIARWIAEEVQFEMLHPERSGVGWYSAKFQRALNVFATAFPELETDQDARDTLTALIAITSDGQKVVPNFAQAIDLYANFRETGKFTTTRGHMRQSSIDNNVSKIQQLYDEHGPAGLRDMLLKEDTVTKLKKIAKELGVQFSTSYQAHIKLPFGAVIFGPKLGAFYANLMGAHGYLTMDRWWSRTFNRYRGQLLQAPTRAGLTRFKELLIKYDKRFGNYHGPEMIDDDRVLVEIIPYRDRYAAKGFKNGTAIEKAANTIYKAAFENLEDQPFNATDRTFMLDAVHRAAKLLKSRGTTISVADIQAVLWYYEKRLYGELGAKESADVSYEEAARTVIEQRSDRSGGRPAQGVRERASGRASQGPTIGGEPFGEGRSLEQSELDQTGIDPDKASAKDIKNAVARYQLEKGQGRTLFQSGVRRIIDGSATLAGQNASSSYMVIREAPNEATTSTDTATGQEVDAGSGASQPTAGTASERAAGAAGSGEKQLEFFPGADFGIDPNAFGEDIEVDGEFRPTSNSDGSLIASTSTALRNFWRWFGDSQAVDKNGCPVVFYHGTRSNFDAFADGGTMFFSNKREVAETYTVGDGSSEGKVISAYLRIERVDQYDAEQRSWNEVVEYDYDSREINDARDQYLNDEMRGFEASGNIEETEITDAEGTRTVFRVDHPLETENAEFTDHDEAADYLDELQEKEREALEDKLRDVEIYELEEMEYLIPHRLSTNDLAGQAWGSHDAVWIDDVQDTADGSDIYSTVVIVLGVPTNIKATANTGAFNPDDPRFMFQSDMGGPRGRIQFGKDKNLIELFAGRDLSTFIHESGHLYLEELRADAMSPDAPQQLKDDWQAIADWFSANGHVVAGEIPTEAHEMWARGFEKFAMEGKAPSPILRKAFNAFKRWFLTIYQVVDNLRSPVTPAIREVMERLLATDEEITAARQEQNIDALFTSAQEAGMTDAEFAAYRQTAEESRDEAHDALLYRTMAAIRREKTQAWKDEAAGVRADVTEQADRQPVFRALRALKEMKLNSQWVIDTLGEDALSMLPRRVPPIHAKNGAHPDDIAEASGFASGEEMVRELMGLEQAQQALRDSGDKRQVRQAQIDEKTQQIMLDRHGDILNDGSIEEEARAAVHNDKQGEVIAAEIRSLARRSGKRPTPYALAKAWAADRIAAGTVVETTSGSAIQRYEKAARKAAKAAEEAMLTGDVDETYRQKQAQMLNNALISEARKAKDLVDAAVSRLGKVAKRKTSPSIDQDYLEQAHALLEQVEFRTRSQRDIDRQQSFEEWSRAQQAAGHDVVVPDRFADTLGTTHWSRLPVSQLIALDEAVSQIIHLGRLKQKLIDAKEARDFDEVVAEALLSIGNLTRKAPSDLMDPSWGERFKAKVASADAALLKMETIVDWLDGNIPNGVFNRIVFAPMAEAQTRESDLYNAYIGRLTDTLRAVPKNILKRWGDHVSPPELINRDTGKPFVFSRQQMISMALNMGNEGNAQRLADGYGWNEDRILEVLNRELTADEWTYVQNVWDIIDGLWPEIEAMERRVNGLAPERIEPRAIETSAGTLRGGYYPAVYDSARDYTAEHHAGQASDLFETLYTRATTRSSATKERADKVKRPIKLDLGVINRHIGEVIHDITHREAVMNAEKFLSDQRIMKAIDETLGPAARKQFRPWLKFVANSWAMERAGNEGIGSFMNKLRSNVTVVGMGFRISTIMMQLAGYSNAFEVVGARWVAEGLARYAAHPVDNFHFIMEKSGEIRHRMDTLDRDINTAIRRFSGVTNPLTAVKRFAFHGIGMMDRVVVIPTWFGAYNKALAGGAEDEQAVYAADKAVRQSQGSGAAKDIAAVARGTGEWGQALKLMTMFYSYVSAVYQRQRTLGRDVRGANVKDIPGLMARAWWLMVVPPLLSELMAGRGPGDDEDWAAWVLKNIMFQSLGAIPLVRDAARPVWDKLAGNRAFDFQLSPIQNAGQSLVKTAGDIHKIVEGDDTKRATRDALETVGYWTGLVPGQVAASTQFLVDVGYGEQEPETLSEWWEGLTTGKIKVE